MALPRKASFLPAFESARAQILTSPWLQGLDSAEAINYLGNLPDECFAALRYEAAHDRPYIQPRGGYATFERQKQLTHALSEAGADFLPLTIDSYTRQNDYDRAQVLLERSEEDGKDYLNGYPLVNHGFEITRLLYLGIPKPVCLRHGTPDARVLVEAALASGITEIEGGAICYSLPYSMSFPVDRALMYWQYVDRLVAQYSTPKRPIHREFFGPLTATMVPPAMVIAINIIEMLLAAEQGVTSVTVSFAQTGSIVQDIATADVIRSLSRTYLDRLNFKETKVFLAYHHWMGAFPRAREQAEYLMANASLIGNIIKADKIITKTRDEPYGIPSIAANVDAVKEATYVLSKFPFSGTLDGSLIKRERVLIEREARLIVDAVLNTSGTAFWYSVYQAIAQGIIDIPFAPNLLNRNQLLTVRDRNFSIRIKTPGAVPLDSISIQEELQLLREFPPLHATIADQMLSDINVML